MKFLLNEILDLQSIIKNTFPNIQRINQTLFYTLEEIEKYRQGTRKIFLLSIYSYHIFSTSYKYAKIGLFKSFTNNYHKSIDNP
jgi:hypothetical protein